MDEPWVCPNCGFTNEYYAPYCISCSTVRPSVQDTAPVSGAPVDVPVLSASPQSPDWKPSGSTVPSPKLTPHELPKKDFTPKPIILDRPSSTSTPVKPAESPRRKLTLPTSMGPKAPRRVIGLVAMLVIGAIAAANGLFHTAGDITTSDTILTQAADPADNAYYIDLASVNLARNDLIDMTNSRWDAWKALGSSGLPTPDYLMVDELVAFKTQVAAVSSPGSDTALLLHETWVTSLDAVLAAETALAAEPTQAALDADYAAWDSEGSAYDALYNYWQSSN